MSGPWREGSALARGATSIVTRGVPGTVEKTLLPHVPPVLARMEADSVRLAESAGLPVAALVQARLDESPPTLVFAHAHGVAIHEAPGVAPATVGEVLADLQVQIHGVQASAEQVEAHSFIGRQLEGALLGDAVRSRAMTALADLPRGSALCHMDLHPLNVLWNGSPVVIDWSNAVAGVPAADVARTRLLLACAQVEHGSDAELAAAIGEARAAFEVCTEQRRPGLVEESREWDLVLAAARLDERPSDRESAALWRIVDAHM